jgi:hypothetical protein
MPVPKLAKNGLARATFENHLKQLITQFPTCNSVNNVDLSVVKWAEPDLNRRPLARKANVLTKLDDQPILIFLIKFALLIFNFSF